MVAALLSGCTINSIPSQLYVVSFNGIPIGANTTQQGAAAREAGYSAEDQKHMIITPVGVASDG